MFFKGSENIIRIISYPGSGTPTKKPHCLLLIGLCLGLGEMVVGPAVGDDLCLNDPPNIPATQRTLPRLLSHHDQVGTWTQQHRSGLTNMDRLLVH